MYSTSSDTDGTEPCAAAGLYGAGHGAGQQRGVRRGFEQVHHALAHLGPLSALTGADVRRLAELRTEPVGVELVTMKPLAKRPEAPPGRALLLVVEVEIGDLAQLVHPVFGVDEADRAAA